MAFIRAYRSSDEENIIHIFRETASANLQEAGDPTLHYASFNWARPYLMLVPAHCLVIDDGKGRAVGYVLGVPDTRSFVAEYRDRFLPYLESLGLMWPQRTSAPAPETEPGLAADMLRIMWSPEGMLHEKSPNLVRRYPAHLHVDILSDYQRQGWGRKMIERTLKTFRDMGVPGIHLGKVGSNVEAGKFYAKLDFARFDEVMDDGKSGEVGRATDGGVYLVKSL